MTSPVEIPLWLFVLALVLAAIAALDKILVPSVRWFLRRRMERAVSRLNLRLHRPISPFKVLQRHDRILRLIYDPKVMEAVVAYARANDVPESVAFGRARSYAREIVPGFSATVYFSIGSRVARWISRALYDVRVGAVDDAALRAIEPEATVVFIINHRSNMDYVLVTWLVSERMTLSYAVGEWARVWPLSGLVRAMGAYFIRRKHLNPLYRRVLERYVQMATREGVAQAIFPEGGLSLDGRVGAAKLGLLSFILDGYRTEKARNVVFIPVGLGYDRVVEDRLLTEARRTGIRRFRGNPLTIAAFILRMGWRSLRGKFHGFGMAGVSFGAPVSLRDFLDEVPDASVEMLGQRLMDEVQRVVPVLPMSLLAEVMVREAPISRQSLCAGISSVARQVEHQGGRMLMPERELHVWVDDAVEQLVLRRIVMEIDGRLHVAEGAATLMSFYAAPIRQRLERRLPPPAEPVADAVAQRK